jgi:hypothetical protein
MKRYTIAGLKRGTEVERHTIPEHEMHRYFGDAEIAVLLAGGQTFTQGLMRVIVPARSKPITAPEPEPVRPRRGRRSRARAMRAARDTAGAVDEADRG